jgi:hypothetical protein
MALEQPTTKENINVKLSVDIFMYFKLHFGPTIDTKYGPSLPSLPHYLAAKPTDSADTERSGLPREWPLTASKSAGRGAARSSARRPEAGTGGNEMVELLKKA